MKTYIKPFVLVTKIETQKPLAGSNTINSVSGLDDVSTSNTDFGGGAADSRRGGSLWDDED